MMADLSDEQIAAVAEVLELDPPFVLRVPDPNNHTAYLEAVHESVVRSLPIVQMRLARGEAESAGELIATLRRHLDTLWDQREQAARRGVRP